MAWDAEYHTYDGCDPYEDDDFRPWDEDRDYLVDGVGFAGPGSALRAETASNPRNLPCPTCGQPNRLTPLDRARHYQCDECANRAELGLDLEW